MKKIVKAVLVVLLVLIIGVGVFAYSKLGKISFDTNSEIVINSDVEGDDEDIDTSDLSDKEGDGSLPGTEIYKDSNVLNILLLGTDERTKDFSTNARSDVMMLLSLNKKEGTAKLVSLERGIGVPIEGRNIDLLTHTFRYGGANLTLQTVRECFRIDVDKYVRVNFNMFEQIINAIGGVDIELSAREADAINNSSSGPYHITVSQGVNRMDGYLALRYARLRKIDDDWHRIARQRNVVQAVVNRTKELSFSDINNVADTVLPMVMTNFTKAEIAELILLAPKFLGVQIEQMTVPTYETCWSATGVDGRKYIGVDFNANAKILHQLFYGTETGLYTE